MNDGERTTLVEQYADAENLDARIRLHREYSTADRDWWGWVFDHYDALRDDADVLEVGCGPGYLWRDTAGRIPTDWNLLLTDFSPGMAIDARETLADAGVDASIAVAAAESLPIPDGSVDAVLANHMLYHTDRDAALAEIRRVLRPGGRLYATTNGRSNMGELRELLRATTEYEPSAAVDFTLESGEQRLARHFDVVRRYDRETALRVPELEPLVGFAASLQGVDERQVADFAALADERLADGPLEIRKHMGMLVGDTARD